MFETTAAAALAVMLNSTWPQLREEVGTLLRTRVENEVEVC
jgi:hypothetical protein